MTTTTPDRVEAVIDTAAADQYAELQQAQSRFTSAANMIQHYAQSKKVKGRYIDTWSKTLEEAVAAVEPDGDFTMSNGQVARTRQGDALDRLAEARAALTVATTRMADFDLLYAKHRWSRFFLVKNNNGHIHSSMGCSTCFPTTDFGWLPDLSGLDEKAAVEAHGALLCTVCFPSAPVEWTDFYEKEKAAKAAAQCPGSGTWDFNKETARTGYYTGNAATCDHCGGRITLTKTYRMRAHKPA